MLERLCKDALGALRTTRCAALSVARCAGLLIGSAAGLAGAQQTAPPARLEPFTAKLADARVLAAERNVPILIHLVLEGEAENDRYRTTILPAPELVAASAGVIVIVANNGTHPSVVIEEVVDGNPRKREMCSAYPVQSCAAHKASWDDLFEEFKDPADGRMHCPQTIVLTSDGKVATRIRRHGMPQITEVLAALLDAQQLSGPGLSQEEYVEVKRMLAHARTLTTACSWPEAWNAWQELIRFTPKTRYGRDAVGELAAVHKGLRAELERIGALLVPGKAQDGFGQLLDLRDRSAGIQWETEITALIKRAENDRTLRTEIVACKLEREATSLLREAQRQFDAGQDKPATQIVKRLLMKRLAATEAHARARELWPGIAAEMDALRK